MTSRETLYSAMFDRLSSALPGYFATRDLLPIDQCPQLPALVFTETDSVAQQDDGNTAPTLWKLQAVAALYLVRPDRAQPFGATVNAAVDQVVNALAPRPGEDSFGRSYHTTLSDLVERAWVNGAVEVHRDPGESKAVVIVPVEMLVS